MNPLSLTIVLLPLMIYAVFLTRANGGRHPFLITRRKNAFLLGFGLSGLFMTGVAPSLLPIQAIINNGIFAWGMIFLLYFLLISYFNSDSRLRVYLYAADPAKIRDILSRLQPQNSTPSPSPILFYSEANVSAAVEISSFFHNVAIDFLDQSFSADEKKKTLQWLAETFGDCGSRNSLRTAAFTTIFLGLFAALVYNASQIDTAMIREAFLNLQ